MSTAVRNGEHSFHESSQVCKHGNSTVVFQLAYCCSCIILIQLCLLFFRQFLIHEKVLSLQPQRNLSAILLSGNMSFTVLVKVSTKDSGKLSFAILWVIKGSVLMTCIVLSHSCAHLKATVISLFPADSLLRPIRCFSVPACFSRPNLPPCEIFHSTKRSLQNTLADSLPGRTHENSSS